MPLPLLSCLVGTTRNWLHLHAFRYLLVYVRPSFTRCSQWVARNWTSFLSPYWQYYNLSTNISTTSTVVCHGWGKHWILYQSTVFPWQDCQYIKALVMTDAGHSLLLKWKQELPVLFWGLPKNKTDACHMLSFSFQCAYFVVVVLFECNSFNMKNWCSRPAATINCHGFWVL